MALLCKFSQHFSKTIVKHVILDAKSTRLHCAGSMGYATRPGKISAKLGSISEKKSLPVETDANVLVNFVCGSNINKLGEDIKIKDDSEYPDWLWTLRLGKPPDLEDMDPNTLEYWRRHRKLARRREFALRKGTKF